MAKRIIALGLLVLLGVAMGSTALAIGETPGKKIPTNVKTGADLIALLENIVNWIFVVVLVGAVIFIVLAGWQFISGGGEPQAVSQARSKLLWAAVGIGVAVLAKGIIAAIRNIIGS
jgi:hypothetical protein